LVLTKYEFTAGVAHQTVKKSKHEVMNRDLQAISGQIDHATDAVDALEECYVLELTQGAFFIFHLLTKPFPSHDQPPIHLDHMTNHLTTHMTSHMTFQSPAPQVTCASLDIPSPDPIPTPDSSLFAYLSLTSGFSARLLYLLHSLVLRLILTPFLLPSRVSQFCSI